MKSSDIASRVLTVLDVTNKASTATLGRSFARVAFPGPDGTPQQWGVFELLGQPQRKVYRVAFCTQPVFYELGQLSVPTLLMIGQKDTTAIGKDIAPPYVREKIGHYPELGRAAAKAIPHATLVEFPDLGHAPQMQDPQAFHKELLDGLAAALANR